MSTSAKSTEFSARDVISAHGGRVTRTRVAVLEALRASAHPMTHDEIGSALDAATVTHDRVTLYRALDWLIEQGIAQRVAGSDRAGRYEIVQQDGHRHAHFHCDQCGQVICLEHLSPAYAVALPQGFTLDRAELVFHGACSDCGIPRKASR